MTSASAEKRPIQVAIVEDAQEIREDFARRIDHSPSCRLLRSYGDAESALADLPRRQPDVVLMDISLPGFTLKRGAKGAGGRG